MDHELFLYRALSIFVICMGAVVFTWLFFVTAPYGRHTRKGWGPEIPSWLGWMVMESPSALGFAIVYALGDHAWEPVPLTLGALWLAHYVHRAYVYPLRLRSRSKPMPAVIAGMAVFFNLINGSINARWISHLGTYPVSVFHAPHFLLGVALFIAGMTLNLHSDAVLRHLRPPGEHGYRIPHGGGFRWVSAPNYLGELIEWSGWALAAWSLSGLAFALFTAANLVPRALSNHRWYQKTFPDYPPERRAVIPGVL